MINIYFQYHSIEIVKKSWLTNIDDFPTEIDNDFLSIIIDFNPLLSILLIDKLFFPWLRLLSFSDMNRYLSAN